MDDNNSRSLDLYEFSKAIKDYMLGFSDSEIRALFNYFDYDRSGTVDYDEFLRTIRGPLNASRKKLVAQAFNKLDKDGNLQWQKDIKQNISGMPGNIIETKSGNYLFSSTIEPIKDKGHKAYLFELDKNGELIFERNFTYDVGIGNVPFLIRSEGQITMIFQKWIGKFGDPFHDIIQIIKLTE